jgi:hypothetical protein
MIAIVNGWLKDNIAAAAFGAAFLFLAKPFFERWFKGRVAWIAMKQEAGDLCRHLSRNAQRIAEMNLVLAAGRIPQRNHIQKLGVDERSTLFQDATLANLPAAKIAKAQLARVRLRNLNLDIAETLRQADADDLDQLRVMMKYLGQVHDRLIEWAPFMLVGVAPSGAAIGLLDRPPKQ